VNFVIAVAMVAAAVFGVQEGFAPMAALLSQSGYVHVPSDLLRLEASAYAVAGYLAVSCGWLFHAATEAILLCVLESEGGGEGGGGGGPDDHECGPGIRQQLHDAMALYKEHKSGVFSALVGFIGRVVGFYALTVGLDMLAQEMQANPDALRLVPECAAGCVKAVRIGCQLVFGVLVAIF
jgi:hypothetical protein